MAKHSKRYRSLAEKSSKDYLVTMNQAVEVLKGFGTTKFDQTVEVAIRLGIDAKQADQLVRGSIVLPHGIGKTIKIAVLTNEENFEEAQNSGADIVGNESLIEDISQDLY